MLNELPKFQRSVLWFVKYRRDKLKYKVIQDYREGKDLLLALVPENRARKLLKALLDEKEFLSPHGLRSLSKIYETPYNIIIDKVDYGIGYEPGESTTSLFGGNSNWRGPVWFPINYLFIDALKEYFREE